jgi:hypothetical protein
MIKGGLKGLSNFIRNAGLVSWQIRKGEGMKSEGNNNYIFYTNPQLKQEDNIEEMERQLSLLSGHRFYIEGLDEAHAKGTNGKICETFSLGDDDTAAPGVNGVTTPAANVGMVTVDELNKRLEEEREKWRRDMEFEKLKEELKEANEEIKELKKPGQEIIRRLSPLVEPAVGILMSKFAHTPQPVAIGRLEDAAPQTIPVDNNNAQGEQPAAQEPEMTTEDEDKVLELYNNWKAVDPNCIELLEAIAKIGISQTPIMGFPYDKIKEMIINQAKSI